LKLIYRFNRYNKFNETKKHIESIEGSLYDFAGGYKKFGLNRVGKSIVYREWAPGAQELNLMGEFSKYIIRNTIFKRKIFSGGRDRGTQI
jgi:hypothetical protein